METTDMKVKLWGTRGSIPTPSSEDENFYTHVYGGNTSCVEICTPDTEIVIDAGSGIRRLGNNMMKRGYGKPNENTQQIHLLLSHSHWDHIQGFPFFTPAYISGNRIRVIGQEKDYTIMTRGEPTTKQTLQHQQVSPHFPVPLEKMMATMEFTDIHPGDEFDIGDLNITTKALNHPDGYIGFRFEREGKSIAYCSDCEPDGEDFTANLLALAKDADLLIHDAQYTPEEYKTKIGWGHSTYEHAIDDAIKANVKKLVLFHHEPLHDDEKMEEIEARALNYIPTAMEKYGRKDWENFSVVVGREGDVYDL